MPALDFPGLAGHPQGRYELSSVTLSRWPMVAIEAARDPHAGSGLSWDSQPSGCQGVCFFWFWVVEWWLPLNHQK